MTKDEKKIWKKLHGAVRPVIDETEPPISPASVASKVLKIVQPELIRDAAHYAFREIARSILREKASLNPIGDREEISKQLDLPGFELLHDKYPKPDGSGYVYIESMTYEEAEWNADQLEKLGRAALRHAQQLRHWIATRATRGSQ
jgi:hypothetical protein